MISIKSDIKRLVLEAVSQQEYMLELRCGEINGQVIREPYVANHLHSLYNLVNPEEGYLNFAVWDHERILAVILGYMEDLSDNSSTKVVGVDLTIKANILRSTIDTPGIEDKLYWAVFAVYELYATFERYHRLIICSTSRRTMPYFRSFGYKIYEESRSDPYFVRAGKALWGLRRFS